VVTDLVTGHFWHIPISLWALPSKPATLCCGHSILGSIHCSGTQIMLLTQMESELTKSPHHDHMCYCQNYTFPFYTNTIDSCTQLENCVLTTNVTTIYLAGFPSCLLWNRSSPFPTISKFHKLSSVSLHKSLIPVLTDQGLRCGPVAFIYSCKLIIPGRVPGAGRRKSAKLGPKPRGMWWASREEKYKDCEIWHIGGEKKVSTKNWIHPRSASGVYGEVY